MNSNLKNSGISTVAIGIIVVIIAAVIGAGLLMMQGGDDQPSDNDENQQQLINVGVHIGIGRGDLGFRDMQWLGAEQAYKDGFANYPDIVVSPLAADYVSGLTLLAEGEYNILVSGGYPMVDSVKMVSNQYPEENFLILDGYPDYEEGDPGKQNTLGLFILMNDTSALGGAGAAILAAIYDFQHVGYVGGMECQVLFDFEIGYKWGVDWGVSWLENNYPELLEGIDIDDTPKKSRVLYSYMGEFGAPQLSRQATDSQLSQGAGVIYQVGVDLEAIIDPVKNYHQNNNIPKNEAPFVIGVDTPCDWQGPGYVIYSCTKCADRAIRDVCEMVYNGEFRECINQNDGILTSGLAGNWAGISSVEMIEGFLMNVAVEQDVISQSEVNSIMTEIEEMRNAQPDILWEGIEELRSRIVNNEVTVPRLFTFEQLQQWRDILG